MKMAKNPNLIQFTLPLEYREKLSALQKKETSPDLVAKRLITELLDGEASDPPSPLSPDALEEIRDRLNQLETGQPEINETMTNLVERIENLEGWISSLRDDRALAKGSLGKFSDRLDALEKKGKVETAPREIPKGMTHKQIAEICDVSLYAVTKMAHDRSKWPEGYMWSDESKKWFPMEV